MTRGTSSPGEDTQNVGVYGDLRYKPFNGSPSLEIHAVKLVEVKEVEDQMRE